jgi:hypothetical protein
VLGAQGAVAPKAIAGIKLTKSTAMIVVKSNFFILDLGFIWDKLFIINFTPIIIY